MKIIHYKTPLYTSYDGGYFRWTSRKTPKGIPTIGQQTSYVVIDLERPTL